MAFLTITSETGMFHSACLLEYSDRRLEWYGFMPLVHRRPISSGKIDTSDRQGLINHYVRFQVADGLLDTARELVLAKYRSATYALGVRDCVSLSADFARNCGLRLPAVNMTPFGLISILRVYNPYTHYDVSPYPWI